MPPEGAREAREDGMESDERNDGSAGGTNPRGVAGRVARVLLVVLAGFFLSLSVFYLCRKIGV